MLYFADGSQLKPGMLHTCLDETGHFTSAFVSFAGWISDLSRWDVFQKQWQQVFAGFVGVESIHMAELMRPESAIKYQQHTFSEDRPREMLIERCIEVIQRNTLEVVACAVNCEDYKRCLSEESRKRIGGDAHTFVFRRVMKHIVNRLRSLGWPYPTALIFDDNEAYGGKCYSLYSKSRRQNPEWRKSFGGISFVDDEWYPPIQAADMLAWLTSKELNGNYDGKWRPHLASMIAGKTLEDHLYDKSALIELEKKLKESPESARG